MGVHDADAERADALAADLGVAAEASAPALIEQVDALFVAAPAMAQFVAAREAVRAGRHVFLEWPPVTSLSEGETLVRAAEEAGVEIGVSRTGRHHPALADTLDARPRLCVLHHHAPDLRWPLALADAVDTLATQARTHAVQRLDAEAVRTGTLLAAVAFTLRFQNGTLAQAHLARTTPARHHLHADAARHDLAWTPVSEAAALTAETAAFCAAVARRRPAPVSLHNALRTLRLVERLMERLR